MNQKQIFRALQVIDPTVCIKLSENGNGQWYVASRIEASDGYILSTISNHSESPQEALIKAWEEIRRAKNILCNGKRYVWDSFMWRDYQ